MTFETLSETEWSQVDSVWDAIEEGNLDEARARMDRLKAKRAGHPDVRIVEAALLLEESEPADALEALRGAERSADPALFFQLRALAHYDLARFEEARADAGRALAIHDEMAEAHDLLSRIHDHLADAARAKEHAEEAFELDAERFPLPLEVSVADFDGLVREAVDSLPAKVRRELDQVPVLVEDLPSRDVLASEDPVLSPDILGLFAGRHLLERGAGESGTTPGVIFLYRRNLLRFCHDREELRHEIKVTVQHEVGHLLGLDEDDLERWGLA